MNEEEFLKEPITTKTIHFHMRYLILLASTLGEINVREDFNNKEWLDKQKVKDVIDNPNTLQVVLKRRSEDYDSYMKKCYKAERNRIKQELGLE